MRKNQIQLPKKVKYGRVGISKYSHIVEIKTDDIFGDLRDYVN